MPQPFEEPEMPELPEIEEEAEFKMPEPQAPMPPIPTPRAPAPVPQTPSVPVPPVSAPLPQMPPIPTPRAPTQFPRPEPIGVEPIPLPSMRRPIPAARPVLEPMPSERAEEKLRIDITKFVRLKDYKRVKEELSKLKGVVTDLIDSLERLSNMEEKEKEHLRNAETAMRDAEKIIKQVDTTLASSPKE